MMLDPLQEVVRVLFGCMCFSGGVVPRRSISSHKNWQMGHVFRKRDQLRVVTSKRLTSNRYAALINVGKPHDGSLPPMNDLNMNEAIVN